MLNFGCLKLWLIILLMPRDSVIYDSESHHHYIAAWCMNQKQYICLYENCLYNRVKFPVDRFNVTSSIIILTILNLFCLIQCHQFRENNNSHMMKTFKFLSFNDLKWFIKLLLLQNYFAMYHLIKIDIIV